jgi:signal transduction histidine kinase/ligand-binding sensor domain-containing protein
MPNASSRSFIKLSPILVWVLLATALFINLECHAQFDEYQNSKWSVRNWQLDDGLPDNRITGLAQTDNGYLWIATRGGLSRFNGTEFESIPLKYEQGTVFNGYTSMFADGKRTNQLWLSTFRETIIKLTKTEFKVYTRSDGVPGGTLMGVACDKYNDNYFIISDHLYTLKNDHILKLNLDEEYKDLLVNALLTDESGVSWCSIGETIGTLIHGVFYRKFKLSDSRIVMGRAKEGGFWITSGKFLLRYINNKEPALVSTLDADVLPTCLIEDSLGAIWIGTHAHGLFRYDHGTIENISISQQAIKCMLEDREGNIWVGTTSGGLNRLQIKTLEFVGRKFGMPFESATSVCVDARNATWVVSGTGQIFNNANTNWSETPVIQKLGILAPSCIISDQTGNLWIGTRGQGLKQINVSTLSSKTWNKSNGLLGNTVRAICVASDNSIWFSTDEPAYLNHISEGKLTVYKTPGGIRNIRSIAETTNHIIYFGTSEGRLFSLHNNTVEVESSFEELSTRSIRCLATSSDGSLWIGFSEAGIGWFNNGQVKFITIKEGLIDNSIWQLVCDKKNNLWVAGPHGITRLSIDEVEAMIRGKSPQLHPYIFGSQDGLRGFQAQYGTAPTVSVDNNGRVFFATSTGLVVAHPDRINNNPSVPSVVIESISLDDQLYKINNDFKISATDNSHVGTYLVHGIEHLDVPPNYNKLFITFSALQYSAPEKIRYRYRIDGIDSNWNELGLQKSVLLPQLGPGDYVVRISASNEIGVWNTTTASLQISVGRFFWQTLWFQAISVVLFTVIVIGIVRFVSFRRLKKELLLAEQKSALLGERARIARDIHDDVGGSLSQIKLISEIAQQYKSGSEYTDESLKQITTTATDMLKSLDEIVWAINPKNDNLPNLISYLGQYCVEKLRNGAIRCILNLPDHPSEIAFSSEVRHNLFLVVKEVITNILKHAAATAVKVAITTEDNTLLIRIEDNGRGFDLADKAASGDGITNMSQRMQVIGGQFFIESSMNNGTYIKIIVPIAQP